MKIPNSFDLLGSTVTVDYDGNLWRTEQALGKSMFNENKIVLDENMLADKAQHTFCHELVHFILYYMSKEGLTEDEEFVDLLGGMLHQALSTMEYDDE